jgi:predicted ATP-grasp superfamily ATP-dependent carboligase
LTGILCGGYLIDELKLPLIGCFTSKKFPPRCVIENGIPSHPIRIFGNEKLIVIAGEFKPVGEELTSSLVEAIISFGKRHRVKVKKSKKLKKRKIKNSQNFKNKVDTWN